MANLFYTLERCDIIKECHLPKSLPLWEKETFLKMVAGRNAVKEEKERKLRGHVSKEVLKPPRKTPRKT